MIDRYLDKLVDVRSVSGGFIELNENYKEVITENVIEISFDNLYSKLLIYFYDNRVLKKFGIISKDLDNVVIKLKYLFHNNIHGVTENKIWRNSIWINEISNFRYVIFELYYQYMSMLYDDLMKNHNLIYIDTDTMYILGDVEDYHKMKEQLSFLPIDISYRNIPYIYFVAKKRYVYSDGSAVRYKGIRIDMRKYKLDDICQEIEVRNRNDKFNKLLG